MAIAKIIAATAATAAAGVAYARTLDPIDPSSSSAQLPARRPANPDALRSQLPMYSAASEPTSLVPVKSPLQDEVAAARIAADDAFKGLLEKSESGKKAWLEWEQAAEGEFAILNARSVLSPQDQLSPNVLYVAIATLAGSIVARN
ncbi:hypothetical protein JCM6882_001355, partial [Rhodosporidiobolus microsporus]